MIIGIGVKDPPYIQNNEGLFFEIRQETPAFLRPEVWYIFFYLFNNIKISLLLILLLLYLPGL